MTARTGLWQTPLALTLSLLSFVPLMAAFGAIRWGVDWGIEAFDPESADGWSKGVTQTFQYLATTYFGAYWPNRLLRSVHHRSSNYTFSAVIALASLWFVFTVLQHPDKGGGFGEWLMRIAGDVALIGGPIWASSKLDER